MTVWGVVASAPVWQVVGADWDKEALPLGWVSFSTDEAADFIDTGGITHLLVEARGDLLNDSLVATADSEGLTLVALITGTAGEDVARQHGVSLRVRQPGDLHHILHPLGVTSLTPGDMPTSEGLSIAVWGPTGAPGRTTVATSVASLMAGRGLRVVLIDGDARSGAIAPALGLLDEVPGFIASCRLAGRDQLTADDLRRLAHRYEQGAGVVDVLTGTTSGRHYPEVTPDTVTGVVEMAKRIWEVVIVDTGSDLSSEGRDHLAAEVVATTCLRVCDEAIALCQATPVGVARLARVIQDAIARRAGKPFPVVLNGVDTARRALSDEATLREALRRFADVFTVQILAWDPGACRKADMLGVTVPDAVPGSPFVSGLKAVVGGWVDDALARRRRQGDASADTTQPLPRHRPRQRGKVSRWRILSKRGFALR